MGVPKPLTDRTERVPKGTVKSSLVSLLRAVATTLGSSLRRAALMAALLSALVVSAPGLSEAAEHLSLASATAVVSQPVSGSGSCGVHGGCLEHAGSATGTVLASTQAPEPAAPSLVAHARRVAPALPPTGERPSTCELRIRPADLCVWRT